MIVHQIPGCTSCGSLLGYIVHVCLRDTCLTMSTKDSVLWVCWKVHQSVSKAFAEGRPICPSEIKPALELCLVGCDDRGELKADRSVL